MSTSLSPSAQRVQDALDRLGLAARVEEREQPTRSAAEAAAAIGCTVGEIAKSIIFRGATSNQPILVVACGDNRIDEVKVAALVGEPLAKADAAFVRNATGFVIGGVPPVAHANPVILLIDEDLLRYQRIWAAAGTPNAVFPLAPQDLVRITGGRTAAVKR